MSAEHAHHDEHHAHGPMFYAGIAVFLGVLTFIELGPLFGWYNLPIPALMMLSLVKFFTVVAFFMHLWDDDAILTRVFAAPLVGALLMVMVLMTLFHTWRPSPRDDNFAVVERFGDNYAGECSSWLRSHISNRMYCASPPIEPERIAAFAPAGGGASQGGPASVDLSGKSDDEKKEILAKRGEELYKQNCQACHQESGAGVPGAFPPLAGSDYAGFLDPVQHAGIIIKGLNGKIVVKGQEYNGAMSAFGTLSDYNIAAIATYERNAWGNAHGIVTPEQVASAR